MVPNHARYQTAPHPGIYSIPKHPLVVNIEGSCSSGIAPPCCSLWYTLHVSQTGGTMPVLGRIKTPDIFYGWVVVLTSSICLLLAYVMWHTWSVFFVAILREFGWSRADTSLAFSVASVMTA